MRREKGLFEQPERGMLTIDTVALGLRETSGARKFEWIETNLF
jgi:hypothetical protein